MYAFIGDIIVVTKGLLEKQLKRVRIVLRWLDEAIIRLKFEKYSFSESRVDGLGFWVSCSGVKQRKMKIRGLTDERKLKNPRKLRSCNSAVNKTNNIIPNLAILC